MAYIETPVLPTLFFTKGLQDKLAPHKVKLCSDHSLVHLIMFKELCQEEECPTLMLKYSLRKCGLGLVSSTFK